MAAPPETSQKNYRIAVLSGDGIGPEVIAEAVRVLRTVESRLEDVSFELEELPMGAGEYLRGGDPMPAAAYERSKQADAILLGAMGLPGVRWPNGTEMAPQLDLRERLELYAGVRPIRLYHRDHSPLKKYAAGEIDFVIFRENTEGMFWSRGGQYAEDAAEVQDTMRISRKGSERLFRAAFRAAGRRRGLVTLVDKSNVLVSMSFFRKIFDEIAAEFPKVETEKLYIDATSLYLVQRPHTFDVLVTENIFGDILSDLAAGLVGGMGMAPSGDIGDQRAMFQPSHGSAPDIAGKGIANPIAAILSAAMMLDWLGQAEGAGMIRHAVEAVCADPANWTLDLGGALTTAQCGDRVLRALQT